MPPAIVVERPNQVTTRVLKALREALGDNTIAFEEVSLARGEVRFELSGTAIKATARDRYSVFPLLQLEAELFWLGAALIFVRELGNYRLKSIGLIVFKGDAIDERKTALFRAEWDNPEPGTSHAQPHWHVYPRIIDGKVSAEEVDRNLTDEPNSVDLGVETIADEDPEWKTASNFHYAMSSRWHSEGIGHHQENLSEIDNVVRWIKSCISYSREQLVWLFS